MYIQTPSSNENTYLRHVRCLRKSQRYLLAFGLGFAFFFPPFGFDLPSPASWHSKLPSTEWMELGCRTSSALQRLFSQLQVSPSVARTGPMTSRLQILLRQTERALVTEGIRTGIQIRGTSSPFPRCRGGKKSENKYTSRLKSKAKKTTRKSAPGWLKPPLWRTGCSAKTAPSAEGEEAILLVPPPARNCPSTNHLGHKPHASKVEKQY